MLVYRLICALMVAWAMNWVLGRPEALEVIDAAPEIAVIGPIAGALVGFLNLAKRQGWGVIVSIANGLWTGILSMAVAFAMYLTYKMAGHVSHNVIADFESFMRVLSQESGPVVEAIANPRLIGLLCAATAVAGIVSEVMHWSLVKLRRAREGDEELV
jgi:uncharacterized membrane protein